MILLLICFVFSFFIAITNFDDDNDGFKCLIGLTCTFWLFFTFINFYVHGFKLSESKKIEIFKENIYSLNTSNELSGSFIIGSGVIKSESQYTYFIENQDGSKQRKSINSNDTKIYEGYNKPYFEETKCKSGSAYSLKSGFFKDDDICSARVERKLYVPKNTIILDFSVK